ncbi:MAG: molybdopterin converting factor subunit 1 [Rhodothalassiaceae bacterium]
MRILYFAWVAERIGRAEESAVPPAQIATVGALVDWLAGLSEAHAAALSDRTRLRCAVNQDFAGFDAPVAAGDEVAFFPPVTGG